MSFFTALLTSKIAAGALAAGTLAVGGTAAAAYTGTLPAPLQQSAHNLIGAPRPLLPPPWPPRQRPRHHRSNAHRRGNGNGNGNGRCDREGNRLGKPVGDSGRP
ncbi:hypothetical protein AHiyo8_00160 [Arthrobacter sp. Hiyo8]|nr:hypothetical protein AHiyo8_00160 [Arthrobacter sp. Hiyo8]